MSYFQRFVGLLLYMSVSVCFVTIACRRPPAGVFWSLGVCGGRASTQSTHAWSASGLEHIQHDKIIMTERSTADE